MPGVTVGQAVDFLEGEAKKLPAGFSHDYLADSRQYVQEGNQLAITLRLRDDHHLPGAGGAVREPAGSAGDHDLACRWRSSAR